MTWPREGCRCGGFTARDISPWCVHHAVYDELTPEERTEFVATLERSIEKAKKRIKDISEPKS